MLFKFVTILAAVATVVSASAVDLEARQVGGLATCNIVTTPSSTPGSGSLSEEFILVFNREFSADLPPGNSIVTGSTSFTGPSGGRYTVQKTTGGTAITAAQTRAIMQAWAGQTFAGAGQCDLPVSGELGDIQLDFDARNRYLMLRGISWAVLDTVLSSVG
ncbi:hypothetical protein DFP72DRAFT_850362 [Ephemerocybe angulata]|uniref:Uncharacterized protein n=1 Tax=Ephemerocybe angulata TaxID=980116 RepID=A0A8H6M1C2_9AGAR|nr:hypothetical protein DFP72DRAFT_850362 [Tulosesus angulatus]